MKTNWVVQSNVPNSDSAALLCAACRQLGRPFHQVNVEAGQRNLPDISGITPPLVFHGLTTLVLRAAERSEVRQGVFYDAANFTHDAYSKGFGPAYLNYDATVMVWPTLLQTVAHDTQPLFIKPADDLKAFTGFVAGQTEVEELHRRLARIHRLSGTVVVGQQHEVDAEWRLFVVDGEVVSGSMYRPTAEPYLPKDLLTFAADIIERWRPAPVFVLDIGRVDMSWRVIECNCFNWSRFYLSDVPQIVERVSQYQEPNW